MTSSILEKWKPAQTITIEKPDISEAKELLAPLREITSTYDILTSQFVFPRLVAIAKAA